MITVLSYRKRRRHCPEDEEEERQSNFREMDALQRKNKQLVRELEEITEELEMEQNKSQLITINNNY